ncbi:hypothetical protein [uncultured Bilophila sp.]|uniref:hypothetical protein n=1 Tax=uncultured Bilophila sp. TaxID=529385 RepID=UPI00266F640F|nr:hypothetical protein [uncultured Bilophila sp.]
MTTLFMEVKGRLIVQEELDRLYPGNPYYLELNFKKTHNASKRAHWVLFSTAHTVQYINDEGENTAFFFADRGGVIGPFSIHDYNMDYTEGWRLWLGVPDGKVVMNTPWIKEKTT